MKNKLTYYHSARNLNKRPAELTSGPLESFSTEDMQGS